MYLFGGKTVCITSSDEKQAKIYRNDLKFRLGMHSGEVVLLIYLHLKRKGKEVLAFTDTDGLPDSIVS